VAREWFGDFSPGIVEAMRLIEKAAEVFRAVGSDWPARSRLKGDEVALAYRWCRRDEFSSDLFAQALSAWIDERPERDAGDRERRIETGLIMALVTVYLPEPERGAVAITESQIAHAGDLLGRLDRLGRRRVVMAWAMKSGEQGEPTAVIRGVLLSRGFAERAKARQFWDEAEKLGQRFPMRIFADPCAASEGYFLTPYQCRCFARHFGLMSESARAHFAGHLAANATVAKVHVTAKNRYGTACLVEREEPVEEIRRRDALLMMAGGKDNPARGRLMEIFGL
jgi:hypothetical protein